MVVGFARHKRRRARPPSPLERRIATLSTRPRVLDMSSSLLASAAASVAAASSSSRSSGARAATRRVSASSRVSRSRAPSRAAPSPAPPTRARPSPRRLTSTPCGPGSPPRASTSPTRAPPPSISPRRTRMGPRRRQGPRRQRDRPLRPEIPVDDPGDRIASPVGPHCDGQAPWVALALQLLHERSSAKRPDGRRTSRPSPPPSTRRSSGPGGDRRARARNSSPTPPGTTPTSAARGRSSSRRVRRQPRRLSDRASASPISRGRSASSARARFPRGPGRRHRARARSGPANHSGLSSQTWTLNAGVWVRCLAARARDRPALPHRTGRRGSRRRGRRDLRQLRPGEDRLAVRLDFGFTDAFCARPGYVLGPSPCPTTIPTDSTRRTCSRWRGYSPRHRS